jgi:hypothetical protein
MRLGYGICERNEDTDRDILVIYKKLIGPYHLVGLRCVKVLGLWQDALRKLGSNGPRPPALSTVTLLTVRDDVLQLGWCLDRDMWR